MAYSQIFSEKSEYLLSITDGEVSNVDSFITWASAIISKAKEAGQSKILFDNRTFRLCFSPFDVDEFVRHMEIVGIRELELRIAVIPCPGNVEISRLVEYAFTERVEGYMRFGSKKEALEWLIL